MQGTFLQKIERMMKSYRDRVVKRNSDTDASEIESIDLQEITLCRRDMKTCVKVT
jgi:hypothetical protein